MQIEAVLPVNNIPFREMEGYFQHEFLKTGEYERGEGWRVWGMLYHLFASA